MSTIAVIYARYSSSNQREESLKASSTNAMPTRSKMISSLSANTATVPCLAVQTSAQSSSGSCVTAQRASLKL